MTSPQTTGTDLQLDIDVKELVAALWRQRLMIVSVTSLFIVLSAVWLMFQTPQYETQATVQINSRKSTVLQEMETIVSNLSEKEMAIQSEVDSLRSPHFAGLIVDKLKLVESKEFNPELAKLEDGQTFADLSPEIQQQQRTATITELLDKTRVTLVPRSLTIQLGARSESAAMAAKLANVMAESYLSEQVKDRIRSTQEANTWLTSQLDELREKLVASEVAVQKYKEENKLFIQQGVTLNDRELSELNSRMIIARADLAEAEARLQQMNSLSSKGGIETAPEVMSSPLIQRLQEQEAELMRRKADLSSVYGEKHPSMIKINAEEKDLERKISLEVQKILSSLRNQVSTLRTREASMLQSLEGAQTNVNRNTEAEVRLQELEREATANREVYESFLSRSKETGQQGDLNQAEARIVSPALAPLKPSYPSKVLALIVAAVLGGGAGVLLAFARMYLDDTCRSVRQLERMFGYPALGVFPCAGKRSGEGILAYLKEKPTSLFAESLRKTYNALRFSKNGAPHKVVMITSSVPDEGKTSLTLALAHVAMTEGLKVIVVDGDMRRSAMSDYLKLASERTLPDVLRGDATLDEAIISDPSLNFSVLLSRKNTPDSNKLMSSENMDHVLRELAARYDLVLLDSPPVHALADSVSIGRKVDASVFLVRWAKTKQKVAREALQQLTSFNLPVAGLVLTQIDMDTTDTYGNKSYRKYYNE